MTIATEPAPLSYNGDDSTVTFAITWQYFAKADVVVTHRGTTGTETTWVLDTDYTLTAAKVSTGGTLTATTAPATNETLVIELEPANTQDSSIPLGGPFPSTVVEEELDVAAQRDAKIEARVDRSIRVPKTDTQTGSLLELPIDSLRASKAFHFDANGKPSMVATSGSTSVGLTAYIQTLADDADAVTARTTLAASPLFNLLENNRFDSWTGGTTFSTINITTADFWDVRTSSAPSSVTISRQAFTLGQGVVPGEPRYYLRIDKADASAFLQARLRRQPISGVAPYGDGVIRDGVRTLAGATATLTFWAKSDIAHAETLSAQQIFGTGGSPSTAVSATWDDATYTVTTSWTKFTRVITFASISGKTLGTAEDDEVQVNIGGATGNYVNDFAQITLIPTTADAYVTPKVPQQYFPGHLNVRLTANSTTSISLGRGLNSNALRLHDPDGNWIWKEIDGAGIGMNCASGVLDGVASTDFLTDHEDEFFYVYATLSAAGVISLEGSINAPVFSSPHGAYVKNNSGADLDYLCVGYFAVHGNVVAPASTILGGPLVGSMWERQQVGYRTPDFTCTTTSATSVQLNTGTADNASMFCVIQNDMGPDIQIEGYCSNSIGGNRSLCHIDVRNVSAFSNTAGTQQQAGAVQSFHSVGANDTGNFCSTWKQNFPADLYIISLYGSAPDGGTSSFTFRINGTFNDI